MGGFGVKLKEFFVQSTPIEEYTRALLELIQFSYFIEEWLRCVVIIKIQNSKNSKPFPQNDKISLDYFNNVSKFLQDVVMVIVLNDLKYMLSFYLCGM